MSPIFTTRMTHYRWVVCLMLFMATMINYMDRQVLSLTWRDFIAPEFGWDDEVYARVTAVFSLVYAVSIFFAGAIVDKVGIKKGYAIAMGVWSVGALLHAFCGMLTNGLITGEWVFDFVESREMLHEFGATGLTITTVSVWLFIACRFILAIGESGSFPAAVEATAYYFPKKDRTFATALFNNGSSVGALFAPVTVPYLASKLGWEQAFLIIGGLGYFWLIVWILFYVDIVHNDEVNMAEYSYVMQDEIKEASKGVTKEETDKNSALRYDMPRPKSMSVWRCLQTKPIWGMMLAKFLTDGVWWFMLFWTPVYISEFFGHTTDSPMGMSLIFLLYFVSMLAIAGGYLPTFFVNRNSLTSYAASMRTMLVAAIVVLVGFFLLPLSSFSAWCFVLVIGFLGASHQTWSACLYTMVGEVYPKASIATIVGIVGFAGGMSSYLVMTLTGFLIGEMADELAQVSYLGFTGKQAIYMMLFSGFSALYLLAWGGMRLFVKEGEQVTE